MGCLLAFFLLFSCRPIFTLYILLLYTYTNRRNSMNAIYLLLKTTGMCASYTLNELSSMRLCDEVYNAGDSFLVQLCGLMEH